MKAVVLTGFGHADQVLRYETQHPKPQRKAGEVLVEVHVASVNGGDSRVRMGWLPKGMVKIPQILGCDVAGVVLEADANSKFKPGDRVVADTGQAVSDPWGTHAEFVSCPESRFAALPASVSFEAGAALPVAGLTAWQALKGSMPLAGKRVLVLGGAGGVGHLAVQIAKSQGAYVAATCSSRNVEFVTKQLGADLAIDYTKGQKLEEAAGGAGSYDLVVDLVGDEPSAWGVLRRRGGRMAAVSFDGILQGKTGGALLLGILVRALRCKLAAALGLCPRYDIITQQQHGPGMGLEEVVGLVASGQVVPHIERVVSLAQVAEAHKHVETGRARGRVVVRVAEADDAAPARAASAAAAAVAPAVAG
ncbi:hypothetical protein CHLRE_06g297400v5 [Chlamydomonas reinhardtii]|uniref:Enoyl reductase (ER) domain-containing protein n=1 Tax=Chlamydomonas reinhardtii TaxID=3055 RepID=A0A2K3DQP6_CHLRE|nr:uncharacterized protein CHLRE_06g297400v5 [Chlamydomonas reinhardtii]PNW82860.1 hypothetical protein CHLRE_06g297400v5 [Chlamydomonas reinhardtii]